MDNIPLCTQQLYSQSRLLGSEKKSKEKIAQQFNLVQKLRVCVYIVHCRSSTGFDDVAHYCFKVCVGKENIAVYFFGLVCVKNNEQESFHEKAERVEMLAKGQQSVIVASENVVYAKEYE